MSMVQPYNPTTRCLPRCSFLVILRMWFPENIWRWDTKQLKTPSRESNLDVGFVLWVFSTRADGLTTEKQRKTSQSTRLQNKQTKGMIYRQHKQKQRRSPRRVSLPQGGLRPFYMCCFSVSSSCWLGFLMFDTHVSKKRCSSLLMSEPSIAQGACWDGDYFLSLSLSLSSCSLNWLVLLPCHALPCLAFSWFGG